MSAIKVGPHSFLEINREERFFCSLLTHGLLSSSTLRRDFYELVQQATQISLGAESDATEVYSEVAWLRDHWRNLGDPGKWTEALEHDRIEFLATCLRCMNLDISDVEGRSFFRTTGKVPKVITPGRWPLASLRGDKQLALLKWAFNSKPDFLLVCDDRAVIIEAKVESAPGKSGSGFTQDEVQQTLCALIPAVAPYLDERQVQRMWLAPHHIKSDAETVLWSDVAKIVASVPDRELDKFSRQGLERFARRVQADK